MKAMFVAEYQLRPLPQQSSVMRQPWNTLLQYFHQPSLIEPFRGNVALLDLVRGINTTILLANRQGNRKQLPFLIDGNLLTRC